MELAHEETSLLFEMYKEEPDEEVHAEIVEAIRSLEKDLQQYELSMLLNGPRFTNSAIFKIQQELVVRNRKTGKYATSYVYALG